LDSPKSHWPSASPRDAQSSRSRLIGDQSIQPLEEMHRGKFFPSLKWASALYKCGWHFFYGINVFANYVEAAQYFRLAADQNYAAAQFYYDHCLQNGIGVPINKSEAG
jgi:TPR repeat protein